jgi:hypothetical protein
MLSVLLGNGNYFLKYQAIIDIPAKIARINKPLFK